MLQTLEWKCKIFAPTENLSTAVFNMQTISLIQYHLNIPSCCIGFSMDLRNNQYAEIFDMFIA